MTLEELSKEVKAISAAMKKLRGSGISERALVALIQHSAPNVGGRGGSSRIPTKIIRAVMDGIEDLEEFLTEDPEE